ncbi:MAG: hypothetical protein ACI89L_002402 [Phycisphaerales bacterium]|jgi:hypothetical protein
MTTDTENPRSAAPRAGVRKPRKGPLLTAALGLLILLVSGYVLAKRVGDYNATHLGPTYRFIQTDWTEFDFAGRPVTITDQVNDAGEGTITIAYGDETLVLPVEIPNPLALPGFDRYRDWFEMQIFAESTRMSFDDFRKGIDDGSITPRLIAVTRNPMSEDVREGRFNLNVPENWGTGEIHRDRWTFTFHEFLPAGGFDSHTLRFPQSGKSFYREQVNAEIQGEPQPTRRSDELREGSWQFQAALPLMPRTPAITMEQQALRNSGWTLPVASASVLLILFSLAWAFAPDRVTEETQTN